LEKKLRQTGENPGGVPYVLATRCHWLIGQKELREGLQTIRGESEDRQRNSQRHGREEKIPLPECILKMLRIPRSCTKEEMTEKSDHWKERPSSRILLPRIGLKNGTLLTNPKVWND